MSIRSFLRDRLSLILLYSAAISLVVTVVELELVLAGAGLSLPVLFYIGLLAVVGLGLILVIDYRRQAAFLLRLEHIHEASSIDQLSSMADPRTIEQELFAQAWSGLYSRLSTELSNEQQRSTRNLHLLSQWAHHMKTPVAVIDLELQKADKLEPPSELADILQSVAEENGRLQRSLQMLLNMIRLEDFASDFCVEQVELLGLVRRVVNDHKRDFIVHHVYPKIEADGFAKDGQTVVVETDAKWLRFVLEQILNNAIKYSAGPERDGQVTFSCQKIEGDTILAIIDNGIGIVPEDLGRVFAPFYTGANGREFPQSTGLGLYLAQDACERLGHRLSLRSARGQGTTVSIRFASSHTLFAGLSASVDEG